MGCRQKVERVAVGKLYVEEEKVGVGMRGKPLGSFFHTAGNYGDVPFRAQAGNHGMQQAGGRNLVFNDGNSRLIHIAKGLLQ